MLMLIWEGIKVLVGYAIGLILLMIAVALAIGPPLYAVELYDNATLEIWHWLVLSIWAIFWLFIIGVAEA